MTARPIRVTVFGFVVLVVIFFFAVVLFFLFVLVRLLSKKNVGGYQRIRRV